MPVFTFSCDRSQAVEDQIKGIHCASCYFHGTLRARSEAAVVAFIVARILIPGKYKIYLHREGWETLKEFYAEKKP